MPRDQRWSSPDEDSNPHRDNDDEDDCPEDESTTTDCIECGGEIYDDAARCPLCGEYQIGDRTGTTWEGRPFWWKLGGVLGIVAVLLSLLAFCF